MLDNFQLKDIKKMNILELEQLAKEVRETIIDVTSKNGGHLASNLGVVELTIALHKVFDSPFDKFIFDVSHQTYTHKILTGRYEEFKSLRKFNGLSGFARYSESEHDVFEAGHSSTAISAGLGYLEAKKTNPNVCGDVIAIVGDASIANGLSFEALNYLGAHREQKMIIIFNDNNMSISPNVGVLAKRYNKIRTNKNLRLLKKITPVRIKHALQYWAYRGDIFTSMDYVYFENIDGHNFHDLIKYLTIAKNASTSTVIHISTKKGKGYLPAELDKEGVWHGVGPFEIESGNFKNVKKNLSFGEILSDELIKITQENLKDIRVITPAMALGSGINKYSEVCKNNFIDVGIAEENALCMASAMANANVVPVVFMYSTFLQRAYDELHHDIARPNKHVVVCVDRAGIVPGDGDTHQGIYDLSYFNSIPGLTILHPTCENDLRLMINKGVKELDGPVIIRYPKGECPLYDNNYTDYFKWEFKKSGSSYVLTYGINVFECLDALNNNLVDCGLICAYSSIIDDDALRKINHSTLYVYEEVIANGSYGVNILSRINELDLDIKLKSLCLPNTYLQVGTIKELKAYYHITVDDLIALIKK